VDVASSSVNCSSLGSTAMHRDMNECIKTDNECTSCWHSNYTDGAANVCLINNVHDN